MTEKVFKNNWISRFGTRADDAQADEPISGTNGATKGTMKGVNDMVRFFLSVAAVPVFGGAGLAILIVGEINFFSSPVNYQVEPLASIGECPIPFKDLDMARVTNTGMLPLQRPMVPYRRYRVGRHRIPLSCRRCRYGGRYRRVWSECRSSV